jgi:hypothetical protein
MHTTSVVWVNLILETCREAIHEDLLAQCRRSRTLDEQMDPFTCHHASIILLIISGVWG